MSDNAQLAQRDQYGPKMVCTFGGPGKFKSVDAIQCWSGLPSLFVGPSGLTETAHLVCGIQINVQLVHFLWDIEEMVEPLAKAGCRALVIDEWHDICQASFLQIKDVYKTIYTEDHARKGKCRPDQVGQVSGYDRTLYNEYERYYQSVCVKLRACGMHVHINSRQQDPYYSDRTRTTEKGGPKCGWKKVVDMLPHLANVCWRALGTPPDEPWNARMDCNPRDENFHEKSWIPGLPRNGGPLNTAEVLRMAGHTIPWPEPLRHLEEWTQTTCDGILAGHDRRKVTNQIMGEMDAAGIPHPHIAWALRHGVHRAELRKAGKDALLAGF